METPTAQELQERRAAWVAALRSGKYRQTRGAMTAIDADGESDCCLGVGCKVAIALGMEVSTREKCDLCSDRRIKAYDGNAGYMPRSVMDFYGLSEQNGWSRTTSLTVMNVSRTFSEIADFIESNPAGLWSEDSTKASAHVQP